MNENKNQSTALDTLLKMDTARATPPVNGVAKYFDVFLVSTAICQSCGQAAVANQPTVCGNKDEIVDVGKALHRMMIESKKIICASPKLRIDYVSTMIDAELLK